MICTSFFQYENQSSPASLSDDGTLHNCQKSQLIDILESLVTILDTEPEADIVIIDSSTFCNILPPRASKSFGDYIRQDLIPIVESYGNKFQRTHMVFDVYREDSLKSEERDKRGNGTRKRVTGNSKVPTNWRSFLRNDCNKTELFHFIADKISETQTRNPVIVTKDDTALSNHDVSLAEVSPCSHEEADTRIFVHARQAAVEGYTTLMIKANDIDVVVVAYSCHAISVGTWLRENVDCLRTRDFITMDPCPRDCLTNWTREDPRDAIFYAFTGCDVVSVFRGKGKKLAWQT